MPNPTLPDINKELSLNVQFIEMLINNKKPLLRDDLIGVRDSLIDSAKKIAKIQDMLAH